MQENDSLPQDLKVLLHSHLNESFELDKKSPAGASLQLVHVLISLLAVILN